MPYKDKEKDKEYQHQYYLKNKNKNKNKNKERARKWAKENPERVKEENRRWTVKNPERTKENRRKWNAKNPERVKETNRKSIAKHPDTRRKWKKNKRATDPNWRLRQNLGTRISRALAGTDKSANTMKLIGCTIEELWVHLESSPRWEPWMTRKNYGRSGGWDIDHIKACANFDLTDPKQQRICCNWSNLQPMEHIENIKKRDKVILGDITSLKT